MIRKHFVVIAQEIKQIDNMAARLLAAMAMCKAAKQLNNKFDQKRFLDACEI